MKLFLAITISLLLATPVKAATPPPSPSPSPTPSVTTGSLWINEILPNPAGTDTGNEWIELYNPASVALAIGGATITRISGTTLLTIPTGTSLPAQGFMKFMASGSMVNTGDTLILKLAGQEIDRITYDSAGEEGWSWARRSATEGEWTDLLTPAAANQFVVESEEPTVPSESTTVTATKVTSASTKATASKTKTAAAAKAKVLPKSGPDLALYLIPLLIGTLYWYRKYLRHENFFRIRNLRAG